MSFRHSVGFPLFLLAVCVLQMNHAAAATKVKKSRGRSPWSRLRVTTNEKLVVMEPLQILKWVKGEEAIPHKLKGKVKIREDHGDLDVRVVDSSGLVTCLARLLMPHDSETGRPGSDRTKATLSSCTRVVGEKGGKFSLVYEDFYARLRIEGAYTADADAPSVSLVMGSAPHRKLLLNPDNIVVDSGASAEAREMRPRGYTYSDLQGKVDQPVRLFATDVRTTNFNILREASSEWR